MRFFNKIFGFEDKDLLQPNIQFGRYTDSYKTPEQYKAWENAVDEFEKGNYLSSYRLFFQYLGNTAVKNVMVEEQDGQLNFEILQGSKKIKGYANNKKVKVAAKVVQTDDLNVSFMRRLMEENYKMKYSCFALDEENDISVVFTTYVVDGSPYKIYAALKEVATKADKLDDLLIEEFDVLHHTDTSLLEEISVEEKEVKYAFIQNNIETVLQQIDKGGAKLQEYPGAIAYLLLNLGYKIDYLTIPEGNLMEAIERIHRLFFSKDGKTSLQKNSLLYKEYRTLQKRPKAAIFKELYRVKNTFGITKPAAHDRVVSFIDGELPHMNWYEENGYEHIALAIPGYIVGYCLFQFAVPKPVKELLHLYYQVTEAAYFKDLGFQYNFVENGVLEKKEIKRAIKKITEANDRQYPRFNPDTSDLSFDNLIKFARSYLLMIRNLNLAKA